VVIAAAVPLEKGSLSGARVASFQGLERKNDHDEIVAGGGGGVGGGGGAGGGGGVEHASGKKLFSLGLLDTRNCLLITKRNK